MFGHFRGKTAALLIISALLLLPAGLAHSQTMADSLTLDRAISDVIRSNNRIAAARFMQESAERRASSTGSWDDPMLMLSVENLPTNFNFKEDNMTMRVTGLSQSIPYSGYKGLEKKASRLEAQAATAQLQSTQLDLVTAAKQAFHDLYFAQQNLQNLTQQHELLAQIVAATTNRLRSNQAGQDEVLTAQADLWRLESTVLSLEQQVDAARYNLNSLRGVNANAPELPLAAPAPPSIPDSADQWIAVAESHYPELQRLDRQAESYRFSASAARRMQWPMVTLFGSYGFRDGYEAKIMPDHGVEFMVRDNMISFGANISLPVFSRGKQRQMAYSMEAMQKSTLADAEQLRRDIRANILSLHSRALRLAQSIAMYRDRILPATQDAYRSALAGYTANRTPFASLLNSAVAIYRDRSTLNELNNELARTMAEIERYTTDTSSWNAGSNASVAE